MHLPSHANLIAGNKIITNTELNSNVSKQADSNPRRYLFLNYLQRFNIIF